MKELIKNGCINLGCKNGWSKDRFDLYRELQNMKIAGSESGRSLGNCYSQSSLM